MSVGTLSHLFGYVSWSESMLCGIPWQWLRQSVSKSTDDNFGRSVMCRKSKSITSVSIYSSKGKALSCPQRNWSSVFNLPSTHWLVTLGNDTIQNLSVGLCYCKTWYSAVGVTWAALMNGSPCGQAHAFLSAWPLCSWFHWAMIRYSWRKTLTVHRMWTWLLDVSSAKAIFWWAFTGSKVTLHLLPIRRDLSLYIFYRYLSHQFFNHALSKSLTIQSVHGVQPMRQYTVSHLAIFPSK